MKNENQIKWKILTLVSLICLMIPLSIYSLWIYVFDLGTTQAERVSVFKDYFPDILGGRWSTTIISIIFSIASVILSSVSLKKIWKLMNILILLFSSILLLLNLFSMM